MSKDEKHQKELSKLLLEFGRISCEFQSYLFAGDFKECLEKWDSYHDNHIGVLQKLLKVIRKRQPYEEFTKKLEQYKKAREKIKKV